MSTPYAAEIAFLNRRLFGTKIQWKPLPALTQIVSNPLPETDAKNLIGKLRDTIGKKALADFTKMVTSVYNKARGGTLVIISVKILREHYSQEIDGWSGGGGHGYNPLSTRPSPKGSGV